LGTVHTNVEMHRLPLGNREAVILVTVGLERKANLATHTLLVKDGSLAESELWPVVKVDVRSKKQIGLGLGTVHTNVKVVLLVIQAPVEWSHDHRYVLVVRNHKNQLDLL